MLLDNGDLHRLVLAVSRGEITVRTLARRENRFTAVANVDGYGEVVVKVWRMSGLRDKVRHFMGQSKATVEYEMGRKLHTWGIKVPLPLAYFRLSRETADHDQAVVIEYIEGAASAGKLIHGWVKSGELSKVGDLTMRVVGVTRAMLAVKILDVDHRIGNFVITPNSDLYRLDFENAKNARNALTSRHLPRMLGGLISSYAWVVRPQKNIAGDFAFALLDSCQINGEQRKKCLNVALKEIKERRHKTGVPVPFLDD